LHSKGILAIEGEAERYVIQGVHMLVDGGFLGLWLDGKPHRSRFVLIGWNLDERELQRGFEACSIA
jgi:G3E family GTPase